MNLKALVLAGVSASCFACALQAAPGTVAHEPELSSAAGMGLFAEAAPVIDKIPLTPDLAEANLHALGQLAKSAGSDSGWCWDDFHQGALDSQACWTFDDYADIYTRTTWILFHDGWYHEWIRVERISTGELIHENAYRERLF